MGLLLRLPLIVILAGVGGMAMGCVVAFMGGFPNEVRHARAGGHPVNFPLEA